MGAHFAAGVLDNLYNGFCRLDCYNYIMLAPASKPDADVSIRLVSLGSLSRPAIQFEPFISDHAQLDRVMVLAIVPRRLS